MSDERDREGNERTARFAVNAEGEAEVARGAEAPPQQWHTEVLAWPQSARPQDAPVTCAAGPDVTEPTQVEHPGSRAQCTESEAATRALSPAGAEEPTHLVPPGCTEGPTRLVPPAEQVQTRLVPPAAAGAPAGIVPVVPPAPDGTWYAAADGGQSPHTRGVPPLPPPAIQWYGGPPPAPRSPQRRRASHRLPLVAALLLAVLLAGVGAGYLIWGGEQGGTQGAVAEQPSSGNAYEAPYGNGSDGSGAQDGNGQYYGPFTAPDTNGATDGATTDAGPSAADVAAIAGKVSPGLVDVNITLAYGGGQGAGTGIVLTPTGEVLTNYHVVQGAGKITVTSVGNGKTYNAVVKGYDRSRDIALLQLQGASDLPAVQLADSSSVGVGDKIVVIGNAGGDGGRPTSVGGAVTALNRDIVANGSGGAEQLTGLIEVAADVQAGHSGGATVNVDGEVIGVTTAASMGYAFRPGGQTAGGTGYAVPIADALAVVEQVRAGQSSGSVHVGATGFLGVQVTSAGSSGYGQGYGGADGAAVAGILPNTPAEAAGLQAGDVITAVDGQAVSSASELTGMLGSHLPGDEVRLTWIDQYGDTHNESITLMEGPPPA